MQRRLRRKDRELKCSKHYPLKHYLLKFGFSETEMWLLLIPIVTDVVDPHNLLSWYRAPTVPDESNAQVPVKHDFSEIF